MKTQFTITEFFKRFPDENTCLKYLIENRYQNCCPRCGCVNPKFYRIKKRRCFECSECGHQLYPTAGTIMHESKISLQLWFCAIYLFTISKNSVSAREIERILGIAPYTARMVTRKIRYSMKEKVTKLKGEVHIDESLFGGAAEGKRGWGAENKTCVFGMIEKGGRVITVIVKDRKAKTLLPIIRKHVSIKAVVHTDKFKVYRALPKLGFVHRVKDEKGIINTNAIEGYWGNVKKHIKGTHTYVSPIYLQDYLDEYAYRHNHRKAKGLFDKMLLQAAKTLS